MWHCCLPCISSANIHVNCTVVLKPVKLSSVLQARILALNASYFLKNGGPFVISDSRFKKHCICPGRWCPGNVKICIDLTVPSLARRTVSTPCSLLRPCSPLKLRSWSLSSSSLQSRWPWSPSSGTTPASSVATGCPRSRRRLEGNS